MVIGGIQLRRTAHDQQIRIGIESRAADVDSLIEETARHGLPFRREPFSTQRFSRMKLWRGLPRHGKHFAVEEFTLEFCLSVRWPNTHWP